VSVMLNKLFSKNSNFGVLLLRLGIAFVFAYAAIDSFIHPNDWVGYMPHVFDRFISPYTTLMIISVYQLVLVGWLLIGRYIRYAAILCALTLAGIIVANPNLVGITFRDVGLLLASLALVFLVEE
jgi:uncharacterized membrane protein YphA (DoxX/SURF4 family)